MWISQYAEKSNKCGYGFRVKIIRFLNGKIEKQFLPHEVYLKDLQQNTVMTSTIVVIDILQMFSFFIVII